MKISVIIPMYNEEAIVEEAVKALDLALRRDFGAGEYEMLFVSDGSMDKCREKAEALSSEIPELKVLGYEKNRGKGCAVRTGMLASRGDFVLFTDCDLAYGADVIKAFYDKFVESGADAVIGSRAAKGGGYDGYTLLRKIMSKTYLKVICIFAGFDLSDSQCGIKGFSVETAHKVFGVCEADGFEFDLEALMLAEKAGCRIEEMPVHIINHRASKVNPVKDTIKMLKQIRVIKKRVKKVNI